MAINKGGGAMNMDIYNQVRSVPREAQKTITGGRLNGMTDINPMWRIKRLTELFGPCGIGWKYIIKNKNIEPASDNQIAAFVEIELFIKVDGVWSDAIPGIGGNMFVAKEKSGLHTSDECYKMCLTDALGVACKALGIGADIYFEKDATKYTETDQNKEKTAISENRPKSDLTPRQKIANIFVEWGFDGSIAKQYLQEYYNTTLPLEDIQLNNWLGDEMAGLQTKDIIEAWIKFKKESENV